MALRERESSSEQQQCRQRARRREERAREKVTERDEFGREANEKSNVVPRSEAESCIT